jgi:hypothetical protein
MIRQTAPRGAAPVGYVAELPPLESAAVMYLRIWFADAGHLIGEDFARALGPGEGAGRLAAFERLMDLMTRSARRPLMHHAPHCKCLGADENAFAHAVAAAATGDRDEATLFLAPLFTLRSCPAAVDAAEQVGQAIARMVAEFPPPDSATRH